MDELSLPAQFALLAVLLVISGFFSMAETAMMASNRHRLRHLAKKGHRGAQLATQLLGKVDRLLGVILLGSASMQVSRMGEETPPAVSMEQYRVYLRLLAEYVRIGEA